MPDIFDEVEEDLRADRARSLVRRFAGLGIGVFVLILVGTAGVVWWQNHRQSESEAVAARFIAASKLADSSLGSLGQRNHAQEDEASRALAAVVADSPAGYRTLARLRLAALQWQMGQKAPAIAGWDAVSADDAAPALLRDLATLTSGQHQVDSGDPAILKQKLQTLTAEGNRWKPMAEQVIALLDLRMGKTADAVAIMRRLSTDPTVPQGVREMAGDLLLTVAPQPARTANPAPAPASAPGAHG